MTPTLYGRQIAQLARSILQSPWTKEKRYQALTDGRRVFDEAIQELAAGKQRRAGIHYDDKGGAVGVSLAGDGAE